jgi:hypothetical protein
MKGLEMLEKAGDVIMSLLFMRGRVREGFSELWEISGEIGRV